MKIYKHPLNRLLLPGCLSLLIASGATANNMDPVVPNEATMARSLAGLNPGLIRRGVAADNPTADTNQSNPDLEFLRVETHRFEKGQGRGPKRWVDVTSYDYNTDELIITVINLSSNRVVRSNRYRNMQPPLSANELKRAINIVFNDPEERALLNKEFLRITGQTLTSIEQIDYKAFTFFADSMPNRVNTASKSCGAQRCAQLLLSTQDDVVFDISPIVNLSEGLVTQRLSS